MLDIDEYELEPNDSVEFKFCNECQEFRPIDKFWKGKNRNQCKNCCNKIRKRQNKNRGEEYTKIQYNITKSWRHSHFKEWTIARLTHCARYRAKSKNIDFNITKTYIKSIWTGKCCISNIEFKPGIRSPYTASLDRINPKLGYVEGNVRIILWGINALKGEGVNEDIYNIAKAICHA